MIRKEEKLIITFYTATDAMAMEKACKKYSAEGRIIPVPGTISADCGLAWCAAPEREEALRQFMKEQNLKYQGIFHCFV